MAETGRFGLPLLEAAQAQKHVTMNEALARADALAAARAEAVGATVPPGSPAEGDLYALGASATGAWTGQDGRLALWLNGGWDYTDPFAGQALWDAATGAVMRYDGTAWREGPVAMSAGGAVTGSVIVETDHTISAGASSTTAVIIPDKAVVIGVSARVTGAIGGAASWSLGVAGAPDRYGTGYGVAANSVAEGVTGQPQAYYGGTSLVLTPAGGNFTGGTVRIAVHALTIAAPGAV